MPFKCSGMQNILNGFLRYRTKLKGELSTTIALNPHVNFIIFRLKKN
jgi:hypothetical protein